MRCVAWVATALLVTSCYDFREAEKTYCLEHLDVCGTDTGPHVEDGFVFVAHLKAATMPPPAADPYAPVPSTAALTFIGVLDEKTSPHRLGYSFVADQYQPTSIALHRFDASPNVVTIPGSDPTGVVDSLEDAWVPDFRDGFVGITAQGTAATSGNVEAIGGPAVARGREPFVAALSPGLPALPSAWVVLQVDPATSDVHIGLRPALAGASLWMGSALLGLSDPSPTPVDLANPDSTLSPAQVDALHRGRQYAIIQGTGAGRGQFLPPGAALYVVSLTGGQKPSPIPGGPIPGVVIWSPEKPSELRVDLDVAQTVQVGLGSAIAGSSSAPTETLGNGAAKAVDPSLIDRLRERLAYADVPEARGQILRPGEMLHLARLTPIGGGSVQGNVQLVDAADGSVFISGAFRSAATPPAVHLLYDSVDDPLDASGDSNGYTFGWAGVPPADLVTAVRNGTAKVIVINGTTTELSGSFVGP